MPSLPIVRRERARVCCLGGWRTVLCLLVPGMLAAQSSPEMHEIMERLDRLEQQNRSLTEEVHKLREDLAAARGQPAAAPAAAPEPEEQVAVNQARIEEMAQTKVETSQHFPLRVTGMALFNAFLNSKGSGGQEYPIFAWRGNTASGGGGIYQSVIGLEFSGPQTVLGGKVHGSLYMDFGGGTGTLTDQDFRIRTGEIQIDWKNQSIMAGMESPIFAPREPNSLAQVEVPPLSGAGNLWQWIPQVRFEQKMRFSDESGLNAQFGFVQTAEGLAYQGSEETPEAARPGIEGRFNFYHDTENARFEFAPGFHLSDTHVAGSSVPSKIFSLDWLMSPWKKVEFTGAFFTGQNTAPVGGLQGFTILPSGEVIGVRSKGGWGQLTLNATQRLSFHLFSGLENGRAADLWGNPISRNWVYGANFFYRLAPNVLLAVETSQARTTYLRTGQRLNNHYDLALAYLF